MVRIASILLPFLSLLLLAGPASAAVDPATKCRIARLKLASKYASCLLVTDAKAAQAGVAADHTACDGRMQLKWAAIEARYGSDCPPTNEVTLVQDILSECTADALVPPASYAVTFRVTNAVSLASLLFTVDYAAASGEFAGSGNSVSCSLQLAGAIFVGDDDDLAKSLELGVVSPTPASTPADLVRCTFARGTWGLPEAGDFAITVDSALDGGGNEITANVAIDSIEALP